MEVVRESHISSAVEPANWNRSGMPQPALSHVIDAWSTRGTALPVAVVVSIFDDLISHASAEPSLGGPDRQLALDDICIDHRGFASLRAGTSDPVVQLARLMQEALQCGLGGWAIPPAAMPLLSHALDEDPTVRPVGLPHMRSWMVQALGVPATRLEVRACLEGVNRASWVDELPPSDRPLPAQDAGLKESAIPVEFTSLPPEEAIAAALSIGGSPKAEVIEELMSSPPIQIPSQLIDNIDSSIFGPLEGAQTWKPDAQAFVDEHDTQLPHPSDSPSEVDAGEQRLMTPLPVGDHDDDDADDVDRGFVTSPVIDAFDTIRPESSGSQVEALLEDAPSDLPGYELGAAMDSLLGIEEALMSSMPPMRAEDLLAEPSQIDVHFEDPTSAPLEPNEFETEPPRPSMDLGDTTPPADGEAPSHIPVPALAASELPMAEIDSTPAGQDPASMEPVALDCDESDLATDGLKTAPPMFPRVVRHKSRAVNPVSLPRAPAARLSPGPSGDEGSAPIFLPADSHARLWGGLIVFALAIAAAGWLLGVY